MSFDKSLKFRVEITAGFITHIDNSAMFRSEKVFSAQVTQISRRIHFQTGSQLLIFVKSFVIICVCDSLPRFNSGMNDVFGSLGNDCIAKPLARGNILNKTLLNASFERKVTSNGNVIINSKLLTTSRQQKHSEVGEM